MIINDLILRAARREPTERTPVWLMRQAGRMDPAYRAFREQVGLPLEALFRDPDLATEISLLPKRLDVDAIIFFQDILTPLAPMGAEFVFRPGPVLTTPIRASDDLSALRCYDPTEALSFVDKTLRLLQATLGFSVIAALAWSAAQSYLMVTSIFPGIAGWACVSFLILAVTVVISALFPRRED